MNEKTEKGPCVAMTPYGVIELERKVVLIKMLGRYRFDYRTSPLTAITFCQVSPNPMAVPKPILRYRGGLKEH